jgi:glycosyltransferase involved in cell wall biosynthesis
MLPPAQQPRVVTTLHGTDTTLLGCDPGYGPAIHHALALFGRRHDGLGFLKQETQRVLGFAARWRSSTIFLSRARPRRSRDEVRRELGLRDEVMLLHSSNLRPLKRIDLLLETAARIRPRESFKLVILAGGRFCAVRRTPCAGWDWKTG